MEIEEFKLWRQKMGFSQEQAAEKLGITRAALQNYERGMRAGLKTPVKIPKSIGLACSAIAAGLEVWQS